MIRRAARNPLATVVLGLAGGLVFVAGTAAVVIPADEAPAEVTETTIAPTTTAVGGYDGIEPGNTPQAATTTIAPAKWEALEAAERAERLEAAEPVIDLAALRPPPDRPTRVRIGKIDVDATIIDLGLNPDRTLEVPEDIRLTGWWTGRSVPGEDGPSIVVGHVDSAAQGPGVFWRLRELDVGDLIHVERSDGSIAEFRVTETELILKDEFPTDKVYGSTEGSKLRLITCGGDFDYGKRSYLGNLIVYAEHLDTTEVPSALDLAS